MRLRTTNPENKEVAQEILEAIRLLQNLADGKVNLRDVATVAASAFSYLIPDYHDKFPGNYTWQCIGELFMVEALGGKLPRDVTFHVLNQALIELPEVVVLFLMDRDSIGWDEAATIVAMISEFDLLAED
jgi:hypothetical protein